MFQEDRYVIVYNQTRETFLACWVKVADTVWSRLVGLLGKKFLLPDRGLWIFPAKGIHSIGMRFPFDVVQIDQGYKVVGLRESVQPFSVVWPASCAESVIELPAHTIFKSRTEPGDQLLIDGYEARVACHRPTLAETRPMGELLHARETSLEFRWRSSGIRGTGAYD